MFRHTCRRFGATRSYHSAQHASRIVDPKSVESLVFTQALKHIPKYGFDSLCITQAIRELLYPDSLVLALTTSPSGDSLDFQLVKFWLQAQRQRLSDWAVDPTSSLHQHADEYQRAKVLLKERLLYNEPVAHHLGTALGHLVVPYNMQTSLGELHALADDVAFYAGDESNDFAWYTKRAGLSSVYVGAELYMIRDTSHSYSGTYKFVDDKVEELKKMGNGWTNVEQWALFNAVSVVNLVKGQLTRG